MDALAAGELYDRGNIQEIAGIDGLKAAGRLHVIHEESNLYGQDPRISHYCNGPGKCTLDPDDAFWGFFDQLSQAFPRNKFPDKNRSSILIAAAARSRGYIAMSNAVGIYYVTPREACAAVGAHCYTVDQMFAAYPLPW